MYPRGMLTGKPEIDDSTAEWIIGSDEAGYGTWAGSLIVVAVAVQRTWNDSKVTDSKKLSEKARVAAVRRHRDSVLWKAIAVPSEEVDEKGVWPAVIQAHNEVHEFLDARVKEKHPGEVILHVVDGLENAKPQLLKGLIPMSKADLFVPAVSLASCFAKTTQCVLMDKADEKYPGYGFSSHRGYGTPKHKAALEELGVCPLHRKSYAPIKAFLEQETPNMWEG